MSTSTYKVFYRFLPLIVATICALLFWFNGDYYITIDKDNGPFEFIKMLDEIAGTLLDFLIGAISLLTAVMDRTLIENMRSNGNFEVLINQTFRACLSLLLLIFACFIAFLIKFSYLKLNFSIIIFLSIHAALSVVAIGNKFKNIFVTIK